MSQEPEQLDQLDQDLDSFFDDQVFDDEPPASATAANSPSLTSRMSQRNGGTNPNKLPLYFDIETVPDDERILLFNLPGLPEIQPIREFDDLPSPEILLAKSLDQIGGELIVLNPCNAYLQQLADIESNSKKPRGGLGEKIKAVFKNREFVAGAADAQRKDMATNPAMCRIVSIAETIGGNEIYCKVVGEPDDRNERDLLEYWWDLAAESHPIITWNGNNFDLRVIMFRSILLGVNPTRTIDLSRYRQDSLDLQVVYYNGQIPPKGRGLKWVCRCLGIEPPAGDVDGSQVEAMWREGRHAELAEYNKSDVWCLRELHRKLSGTFVI